MPVDGHFLFTVTHILYTILIPYPVYLYRLNILYAKLFLRLWKDTGEKK